MKKIQGLYSDFAPAKREGTQIIVSYGYEEIGENNATWFEVSLPNVKYPLLSFVDIKNAILDDINEQTDKKILSGFVWNDINVWLSAENQRNFSEAQRMADKYGSAVLPLTFKLGETADEQPVYHTFETVEELDGFYAQAFAFVNQCLNEGWLRKDAIDWTPYKAIFPNPEEPNIEEV